MAQRSQKSRKTPSGEWLYLSVSAHPEEIAAWRELAAAEDRSLSWWVRNQLNKAAGITNGAAVNEIAEKA
jgi:hypothetical protein